MVAVSLFEGSIRILHVSNQHVEFLSVSSFYGGGFTFDGRIRILHVQIHHVEFLSVSSFWSDGFTFEGWFLFGRVFWFGLPFFGSVGLPLL